MTAMRSTSRIWTLAVMLAGCDASCDRVGERKALSQALGAHDCPPDVAVCIGGETFVSVGAVQGQGEPCRQLSLGLCETGCVAEGVPVSYVGSSHEQVRAQLCKPARAPASNPAPTPAPTPALAPVPSSVAAAGTTCSPGDVVCADGAVQLCGKHAARCEHGCATDDLLNDEPELTLQQATQLLCVR